MNQRYTDCISSPRTSTVKLSVCASPTAAFFFNSLRSLWAIYENAQIDLINLRKRTLQITLLFGHAHTTHNAVKYINVYVNIYDKDLSIWMTKILVHLKLCTYINKTSRIVCHVETNESGRASLNARSLCSEQNQIDLRDLIGENERGAFGSDCSERRKRTANFCSDQSERSDLWKRTQPLWHFPKMFDVRTPQTGHRQQSELREYREWYSMCSLQARDGHGSKFLNPTQPNPSAIIGTHNSVMKVRHKSM